jgi:DNA-binding CsgD family transcriptional regulator
LEVAVARPLPAKERRRKGRAAEPTDARLAQSEAAEMPRQTGIRVAGSMPWGTHICVFYETSEDLLDTCVSYFAAGLASNELCVWAVSDPISRDAAMTALHRGIPNFDGHLAAGRIELIDGRDWYLPGDQFEMQRITAGWDEKLRAALAKGYDGMRVSGNAFWIATEHWKEFCEYEHELDRSLDGRPMIVLCTYPLPASRAVDVLDVARAHHCTIARRHGDWEFLETPELWQAKREIRKLSDALDILSKSFPGHRSLTPRERIVLAHIVKGASSKETAQMLGIAPRTVEFHRANLMRKLGAKNTADLVREVLTG